MKWIAITVGGIVAIVLLIVMIGSLLPRDHVATVSARISAPPAKVWAAITQPDNFTTWRSDLTRVEMLPSTPSGASWREHSRNGAMTMVIESADRFGLAQLHQLRGRVGRGTDQSYCVLVTDAADDSDAMTRLRAVQRTTDGFELAELDIALRMRIHA